MEARSCRNKFILYGLLFIGSWLLSCLLHFQFLHIPILSYTYKPSSHRGAAARPTTSLLLSPQPAVVDHRSCNGRRVFMLHPPSRFNLLRGCLEGSPEFEDACIVMSNAGLGPELVPLSGNHTNGVIPNGGWFNTNHHALEVMFHTRMWRYECLTDNPAAATAVYVPYYPGLELNHYTCDTSAMPYGDSFMRRSSIDAVVAGCIPVFFHEASTLEKQYRWHEPARGRDGVHRRYSVFIDNDHVLEGKVDIEEVLSRFTDEEVAAMREEVIKMIPRFVYTDPRVRFEGDMRDGFDIAIDEVMARMMRIENGEDLGW
uniref:Xyloglucan galactosyltransferase KATAMARI1-like protein n=1 Tax=Aegilops tauschii TaxID=37682 RepID=M8BTI5_AEGTA